MPTKKENKQYYIRLAVVGGVILAIVAIFGAVSAFQSLSKDNSNRGEPNSYVEALLDAEQAKVELIQAALTVYYVQWGHYPVTLDTMYEFGEMDDATIAQVKSSASKLKDLEYKVRGDKQAYQLIYIDLSGNEKTVEGNYQNEYH